MVCWYVLKIIFSIFHCSNFDFFSEIFHCFSIYRINHRLEKIFFKTISSICFFFNAKINIFFYPIRLFKFQSCLIISFSRLQFINCIMSIKNKFSFKINALHFSNPFIVTSIFTSKYLSLLNINECHNPLNCEILQELF